jgi:hypothetical protein
MTAANGTARHANGRFPRNSRQAAELYLTLGLAPIPLAERSKVPALPGWPDLRLSTADLEHHFPKTAGVAVLNGGPSGNLADVDLDCAEARRAAPLLLPATGWVFGRKGSPRSHRIYKTHVALDKAQCKFVDLGGTVLLELRAPAVQRYSLHLYTRKLASASNGITSKPQARTP